MFDTNVTVLAESSFLDTLCLLCWNFLNLVVELIPILIWVEVIVNILMLFKQQLGGSWVMGYSVSRTRQKFVKYRKSVSDVTIFTRT